MLAPPSKKLKLTEGWSHRIFYWVGSNSLLDKTPQKDNLLKIEQGEHDPKRSKAQTDASVSKKSPTTTTATTTATASKYFVVDNASLDIDVGYLADGPTANPNRPRTPSIISLPSHKNNPPAVSSPTSTKSLSNTLATSPGDRVVVQGVKVGEELNVLEMFRFKSNATPSKQGI